jgi:predicted NAD/FAD-dependent oxidoreductase
MPILRRLAVLFLFISTVLPAAQASRSEAKIYDMVVYGGTSAGVAAGIQAKREGRSVIVLEPSAHIGGLTTGGLGQTDIGNKHVIGGISREFYQRIRAHYRDPANWRWQEPDHYQDAGQTRTDPNEDAKWTFEPSAAQAVLAAMIADADLTVLSERRLRRDGTGVVKDRCQPPRDHS